MSADNVSIYSAAGNSRADEVQLVLDFYPDRVNAKDKVRQPFSDASSFGCNSHVSKPKETIEITADPYSRSFCFSGTSSAFQISISLPKVVFDVWLF